jgi:hypothetical protein
MQYSSSSYIYIMEKYMKPKWKNMKQIKLIKILIDEKKYFKNKMNTNINIFKTSIKWYQYFKNKYFPTTHINSK